MDIVGTAEHQVLFHSFEGREMVQATKTESRGVDTGGLPLAFYGGPVKP